MDSKARISFAALIVSVGLVLVMQSIPTKPLYAEVNSEKQALAENLTALFRAYRATITKHKDGIHKPDVFFTTANIDSRVKVMHKQAKMLYKVATKKEYPTADKTPAGKTRRALELAFEKVLRDFVAKKLDLSWTGENEYVRKWDGKFLPARFAANAARNFNEMTGGKVTIKLTTSRSLLVNKSNAPDEWESETIEKKLINTNKISGKAQIDDSGDTFRYLLPEFYGKGCIGCHGTSAKQEGHKIHPSKIARKIGDFAGAISVSFSSN